MSAIALVLSLSAVAIFCIAIREFKGANPGIALAGVRPQILVTTGPYRLVRHPVYFAYVLNWLAFAVLCQTLLVIGVLLIMGALYWYVARDEERGIALSPLADDYLAYSRRVPMMIPFFGKKSR